MLIMSREIALVVAFACMVTDPLRADFLTQFQSFFDDLDGPLGLRGAQSVVISPDRTSLYVAGFAENAITHFQRDLTNGELTVANVLRDGFDEINDLRSVASVTVSPDSRHLYAAGLEGVSVFSRTQSTGALELVEVKKEGVEGVSGIGGASFITVSPDGKHVYVAGTLDDAVVVFARSSNTGRLSFVDSEKDGVAGVDGLDHVNSLSVSSDGNTLYATGGHDEALIVFRRNSNDGSLTFLESWEFAETQSLGLDGANSVDVSPDGKTVYSAGAEGDAITAFNRDLETGRLTILQTVVSGADNVERLDRVRQVRVSPGSDYLYAVSEWSNAICIFHRDQESGELTFLESLYSSQFLGQGDVPGLLGARAVSVSPDASYVYVASSEDHALTAYFASEDNFVPVFKINNGLNDAWFNPVTPGQGFFVNVFPDIRRIFLGWFTFDLERPVPSITANLGDSGHRWVTAFGTYDDDSAELEVETTSGGLFDAESPVPTSQVDGTISLTFSNCNSAVVTYDLLAAGQFGQIPIQRISLQNLPHCLEKDGIVQQLGDQSHVSNSDPRSIGTFSINPGLNDAWFNPSTAGQGFFVNVFPESETMFLSWFTYDTERPDAGTYYQVGEPGHRWLTAYGPFSGNLTELEIEVTTGGVFNSSFPTPAQTVDGYISVEFVDCNEALITYDIPSIGRSGIVPIERLTLDNVGFCEELISAAK